MHTSELHINSSGCDRMLEYSGHFSYSKILGLFMLAKDGTRLTVGCVTGYQVIRVIRIFAKTYPFE